MTRGKNYYSIWLEERKEEEKEGRKKEKTAIQKTPFTSFAKKVAGKWGWSKGAKSLNRKDGVGSTAQGRGGHRWEPRWAGELDGGRMKKFSCEENLKISKAGLPWWCSG